MKPRMIASALVFSVLLGMSGRASAADVKEQAAARAKQIAPFVSEQTVMIAHIDWSRIPHIAPFLDALAGASPLKQAGPSQLFRKYIHSHSALLKSGVKETYVFFDADFLDPQRLQGLPMYRVVIPLEKNVDPKSIQVAIDPTYPAPPSCIGDFFLFSRLQSERAAPLPNLPAAFEAAADADVRILFFTPTKRVANILEDASRKWPPTLNDPRRLLMEKCRWIALGLNISSTPSLQLTIQANNADDAETLKTQIPKAVADIENALLPPSSSHKENARLSSCLILKATGDRLHLTLDEKNDKPAPLTRFFATPVAAARQAAQRAQSISHLQQFGLAMHNHHDRNRTFPPRASRDKNGKPLLSWRVALLPYLDQEALYDQFHLDEPWDSEHNKKLIAKMPDIYRTPGSDRREPGMTNYVVPVGPGTIFGGDKSLGIKDITDGTSNTIMIVEANDECAVIWTKPDDLPWDPKDPVKGLGGMSRTSFNGEPGFLTTFCDASARVIQVKLDRIELFFTAKDGQVPPND